MAELIKTIYFTPENAKFYRTKNGFAALEAFMPPVSFITEDSELEQAVEQAEAVAAGARPGRGPGVGKPPKPQKKLFDADAECKWQDLGRIYFHRAFPFDLPDEFISVLDKDSNEYGIIRNINVFNDEMRAVINDALTRKYYSPVITKINSLKDQFGYSYWSCIADGAEVNFALRDTFKSIVKINENKLLIIDADGNRFIIEDLLALDRKSYRKIELYL